jgi:hypothetical protein
MPEERAEGTVANCEEARLRSTGEPPPGAGSISAEQAGTRAVEGQAGSVDSENQLTAGGERHLPKM